MNASQESVALSERLEKATEELRRIQDWLISGDIDPRVLTDFRDTVNRLRTLAWAVQNYAELKCTQSAKSLTTILASERVRVAHQLCRVIGADLANDELRLDTTHLVQLYLATKDISSRLAGILGRQ